MHSDEITRLISQGQGLKVAFARRTSPAYINERAVIESLTCLANGEGGTLCIGVDQDGTVSGCYPFHSNETDPHALESMIKRHTSPPLASHVDVVQIDGEEVVAITVEPSLTPVATRWGVYRARRLNTQGIAECHGMDPTYLFTRYRDANGIDWARIPATGATEDDLDPAAFDAWRELIAASDGDPVLAELSDDDLVRALGLRDDSIEPITLGAVLLFGTPDAIARHLPYHRIVFVEVGTMRRTLRSSAALAIFLNDLHKQSEKLGVPVKELVVNAVTHRDYFLPQAIYVSTDDKRTSVTSPGGFPRGVTGDKACSSTATYAPRSLVLSTAISRSGIATGAGLGLMKVTTEQLQAGHPAPTFQGTHDQAVTVTVSHTLVDDQLPHIIASSPEPLSLDALHIVHYFHTHPEASDEEAATATQLSVSEVLAVCQRWPVFRRQAAGVDDSPEARVVQFIAGQGEATSGDVATAMQVSQQRAYRLLKKLVDQGRLEKTGQTRTTRYRLP
ncbi:putative DNA binding domain-containing protein [Corynebacterium breve]|uniref:DNA binding domain-containing protein n=1 Tax=Corynebacterium breve TaxID=3049799 RepID=A0ABY8VHE2_9CORY|nr:RNA-binding domain-containing protein [Corynebacterium breve]WIM67683.1 putative DNA binding domain-containing protein [Corynebacterium breve]